MLTKFLDLVKKTQKELPSEAASSPLQIAVAALLVEAARADQHYAPEEIALITRMLQNQFNLTSPEAEALRLDAEAAQDASNDLYQFSSVVKNELDYDGKIELVENLWAVILSDTTRDPYEEALVRRLIGLIYVSDQDSNAARKRAEKHR